MAQKSKIFCIKTEIERNPEKEKCFLSERDSALHSEWLENQNKESGWRHGIGNQIISF